MHVMREQQAAGFLACAFIKIARVLFSAKRLLSAMLCASGGERYDVTCSGSPAQRGPPC